MKLEEKSVVLVIADGIDASTDGRGFTGEHKKACDLANAAPDMLAALEDALKLVRIARQHFPKSIKNRDTFTLELTCATIGKAIAKARGEA